MPPPPPISKEIKMDLTLIDYWQKRLEQSTKDRYRGRGITKMPEDLRTYQHVIEDTKPDVIVELGAASGGSALWFADQMMTLLPRQYGGPTVISVDLFDPKEPIDDPAVLFFRGDLRDPKVVGKVVHEVGDRHAMVVEDSAHSYDSTMHALSLYHGLVAKGCFFVVEDGIVDEPALRPPGWRDRGVQRATTKFCEEHPEFERHHIAPYGITSNIGGWLKRHD